MCDNTLWIYWKSSERQRHKIGELTRTDRNFIFRYTLNTEKYNVKLALKKGFVLFPEFPDLEKEYVSDKLFKTFVKRLPDTSRKDFNSILNDNGVIDDNQKFFELLKKTGGRLITDSIDLIQPINDINQPEITRKFPLAGVEYYDVCEYSESDCKIKYDDFNKGEFFDLIPEPDNKKDKNAVIVKKGEIKLGYIPRFYAKIVNSAIQSQNHKVILKFEDFYKHTNCPDCLWVTLIIKKIVTENK